MASVIRSSTGSSPGGVIRIVPPTSNGPRSSIRSTPAFQSGQRSTSAQSRQTASAVALVSRLCSTAHTRRTLVMARCAVRDIHSPPAGSSGLSIVPVRHAILGAGGVGGLVGGVLARTGANVVLLVRPDSLAEQPTSLRVESVVLGDFEVSVAAAAALDGEVDALWVTVKATQLQAALQPVPPERGGP